MLIFDPEPPKPKSVAQSVMDDVLDRFKHFTLTNGDELDLTDDAAVNALYQDARTLRNSPVVRKAIEDKKRELEGLTSQQQELAVKQAQVALQLESYEDMKRTMDTLAVYVREHYQEQIAAGLHNGKRLEDVLIGYLERGRTQQKATRPSARWKGRTQ